MERYVESLLGRGVENAIPAKDLQTLMGVSDTRVVRKMIEKERIDGAVILSDDKHGYYLPSEDKLRAAEEIRRFVLKNRARRRTNAQTTASAERLLRQLEEEGGGQYALFDLIDFVERDGA